MNLDLKIKEVINETHDAITIVFERPDHVNFVPGQFLTLINTINGEEVRRSYSLCSAPFETDRMAVTVKRVDGGLVSNYLNDHASEMDSMTVMPPMGAFTHETNPDYRNHYVMFAGGSGITPIMSIVKTVLKEEPNSFISLIYANRDEQSIIFREELEALVNQSDGKLKLIHIIANPSDAWKGRHGMINGDEVVRLINSLPVPSEFEKHYFMCGPDGYMKQVEEGLQQLGINNKFIHKESFTPGSEKEISEEVSDGGTKRVKIIFDGEEYEYDVEPGETILDAGLDEDIDLPYSCQSGVCTACRGKALSGKVDLSEVEGLSDEEIDQGYVLCCVGHPLSEDVVIEIG